MTLMEPYFGRGYNITMDNFFYKRWTCTETPWQTHITCRHFATKQKKNTSLFQNGYTRLCILQLWFTEPRQVPSQANENCCSLVDTTQRCCMSNRWEKARISPLLQRKQVRSGHAGFQVSADVYKGRLSTMAAGCLLEHTGHSWHQCVDPVQKNDECTDITATVLASVVRRTERNINIIRKHTSSSINLIVFNHDSTW